MKKLTLLFFAIILTLSLVSCGDNAPQVPDGELQQDAVPPEGNPSDLPADTTKPEDTGSQIDSIELTEVLNSVVSGITSDELVLDTVPLDDEMFPSFFFVEAPADYEAYVSIPMIGSIAHQVAIVRVADGTDVEALAAQIEENIDPRKWICAEAEKSAVLTKGNTILLVMSSADVVDAAVNNFNAL